MVLWVSKGRIENRTFYRGTSWGGLKLCFFDKTSRWGCSRDPELFLGSAPIGPDFPWCTDYHFSTLFSFTLCVFMTSPTSTALIVLLCIVCLSPSASPQPVEADCRPPWDWFCWGFLPVKRKFFAYLKGLVWMYWGFSPKCNIVRSCPYYGRCFKMTHAVSWCVVSKITQNLEE